MLGPSEVHSGSLIFLSKPNSTNRTKSLVQRQSRKTKSMETGIGSAGGPSDPSHPQIIFDNWLEMLNRLQIAHSLRHGYREAIERYLDYCRLNGLSVRVERLEPSFRMRCGAGQPLKEASGKR